MEVITIILSTLMGLFSPLGAVSDEVAEQTIRNQLHDAEAIAVRIDNTPTYQLLNGQVDRIRIAGRGLFPLEGVRIDTLDIETAAIDVNVAELRQGDLALDQPLQGVVHLSLTLEDINQALQSSTVTESLRDISLNALGDTTIGGLNRSDVVRASLSVAPPNRLRLSALIREQATGEELDIVLEFGLRLLNGYQIQIESPQLIANEQAFPDELLSSLTDGVTQAFTLRNFESQGMTLRLLELKIDEEAIQLTAFARLEPSSTLLD
ncbi:MAG: DUF2993 domain-containing protein [Leptolyngbyaceae bacterium]|nr:DUF2993 domain-containing protein [Leptolyngbyaceae bacterium]